MRMKGPRARVRGRVWEEMGGLECEMVESRRTLAPWLSRTRLMVDVVRGPRGRGWADAVGLRPWARAEAVCGFFSIGRGVAAHGLWSGEGGFLGIETRARAWGIISGSYQNSVHAQTHGRTEGALHPGPAHERSVSLCLSPRRCRENENLEGRSRPRMRVWERHKLTRGVSDSSWICRVCFQGPCIYLTGPAVAGGQLCRREAAWLVQLPEGV